MPPAQSFRVAFRLALATTLVMFGLMVLGSVVRATGSGLACPDWPLCHGRLIPPLEFKVLIEWFHRLFALIVSLLLAATAFWVAMIPALRARLGGLTLLAVTLLGAQILLGALTVWKLLDPGVVSGHLAVALLLFATTLVLTLVARVESAIDSPVEPAAPRAPGLLGWFATATAMTYIQSLLGGLVSTHHAGLACPDWPTCYGRWFPPLEGAVGLQMIHRYGAYVLSSMLLVAVVRARSAPDPGIQAGGVLVLSLTVAQIAFGVCNVLLGLPAWLSALHLATATTIFALMITITFRAAMLPVALAPRLEPAMAR